MTAPSGGGAVAYVRTSVLHSGSLGRGRLRCRSAVQHVGGVGGCLFLLCLI